MINITLRSNEDLTTLERGYTSNPIDMPETETFAPHEYVVSAERFLEEYGKWNRDDQPMLGLNDELTRLEIWLGSPEADKLKKAIDEERDSVDLF